VALESTTPGDAEYTRIENTLRQLGVERDQLVSAIRAILTGATNAHAFSNQAQAGDLGQRATQLLGQAQHLG
jgi:hypothetical protein